MQWTSESRCSTSPLEGELGNLSPLAVTYHCPAHATWVGNPLARVAGSSRTWRSCAQHSPARYLTNRGYLQQPT